MHLPSRLRALRHAGRAWLLTVRGLRFARGAEMTQPFNASNQPGTCVYCGRKLYRARGHGHASRIALNKRLGLKITGEGEPEFLFDGRRGYRGSDLLCSLACGYAFGLRAAQLGFRLQHAKSKE